MAPRYPRLAPQIHTPTLAHLPRYAIQVSFDVFVGGIGRSSPMRQDGLSHPTLTTHEHNCQVFTLEYTVLSSNGNESRSWACLKTEEEERQPLAPLYTHTLVVTATQPEIPSKFLSTRFNNQHGYLSGGFCPLILCVQIGNRRPTGRTWS